MSNYPTFDGDSYPTKATLKKIRTWPDNDFVGLMEFVEEEWKYPHYFKKWRNRYTISTGGWSGNESLINALHKNQMFMAICWLSSERGGHYKFQVPKYMYKKNDKNEQY